MERLHVIISGRVIGVCFRAFVQDQAKKLGLKGWVRNTEDGKVEAIFEGEKDKLGEMLKLCKNGPEASSVKSVDVHEEKHTGEFRDFEIRP